MKKLWIGLAAITLSLFPLQAQESGSDAPRILGFNCYGCNVSDLDVSGCTALTSLSCSRNQLTSLDVSGCTNLNELDAENDYYKLTVDTLKIHGKAMESFTIGDYSSIKVIDASECTSLKQLYCSWGELTSLDVSGCTALTSLSCSSNQLTSLDVSGCTALTSLSCSSNQLTSLDVSGCTALTHLDCKWNAFTSLDVSGCTALTSLYCIDNQLTSLDVSGCTALTFLSCDNNQLTSLDVSGCTALTLLSCDNNQLTSLDVSGCTALTSLSCDNNQLTSLDVSGCTALTSLSCDNNQLTSLDVSGCTALTSLYCDNNQLTSLDVSGCTALTSLYCKDNQLTSLDVSGCTSLTSLDCTGNALTSLDVSGCTSLTNLYCDGNRMPLSVLYDLQRSSWYRLESGSQSDSITILINQDFDLSSERIIGQILTTFELTDAYNKEVPEDFWTENRFSFQFHEPLRYRLNLQNSNLEDATFTWHVSVVEEMPVQYYTVKVSSNNTVWGTVKLTGNGRYEEGTEATVTATPKEGYRFVNWTKKDGTVFSTEATHTFKVTENLELTANFEKRPDDVETFTVTLAANNAEWGRVSISGDGTYGKDENVTITATPNKGYCFVNWTKDGKEFATGVVHTFAVTADMELTANFEEDPNHVGNEGQAKDNFRVWAQDRVIYLSADKGDVQVYNALGQCLYSGRATAIPVRNGGLYIVRNGKDSYKVMAR
ncbi:MAG: leucine-rich repeat domain-containing protein [Bacteroides sp.]|nr:leucine-rich repeat domain-containing protein [Bacteroides sp.]MCM1085709.1 leucine-rich repeat domain-containing protein [Bacteroides sp.]